MPSLRCGWGLQRQVESELADSSLQDNGNKHAALALTEGLP
jgi:hypothetical protein